MVMKNQLFGFLLLLISSNLFGQKSFVVQYDKISENSYYFEKVKGSDKLKPVKAIFPRKGDHIQLIVKNANPFIYKVSIDVNEENNTRTTCTGTSELFSLLTSLSPTSNLGFLMDLPSTVDSRGVGLSSSFMKSITDIHSELTTIQRQFVNTNSNYLELIKILKNETLPFDSIKSKSLEIIDILESDNSIKDSKFKIKKLENDLTSFSPTNDSEKKIILDEIDFINELNKSSTLNDTDLQLLKELILSSKNEFSKRHTVGLIQTNSDDNNSEKNAVSEKTTDLVFTVKFDKINLLDQLSNIDDNELSKDDYYEYFNIKRWKDKNGLIMDGYCHGCQPIRLATGYIKKGSPIPSDYTVLMDNKDSGAYGIWNIYNEFDSLETSIKLPNYLASSDPRKLEIEETYTEVLNIRCQDSNSPKWSSGLFLTTPLQGRSAFSLLQSITTDSLLIIEEKTTSLLPSIGATISFQPLTSNALNISYNLGVSLNTFSNIDENKINILGGIGFSHRDWNFISVTAGASLCRTSQLKSIYQANSWYDSNSLNYSKLYKDGLESFYQDVFKLGYYIGFHFNF